MKKYVLVFSILFFLTEGMQAKDAGKRFKLERKTPSSGAFHRHGKSPVKKQPISRSQKPFTQFFRASFGQKRQNFGVFVNFRHFLFILVAGCRLFGVGGKRMEDSITKEGDELYRSRPPGGTGPGATPAGTCITAL